MPVKHQVSQTQSSQAGGGWEDIRGVGRSLEIWFGWQQKINAGQEGDEGREAVCTALLKEQVGKIKVIVQGILMVR